MSDFSLNDIETREFWPFSLAVYRRPGVDEACLRLQDEFGLDVNCVLFCCWAATRYEPLTELEIKAMVAISRDWNQKIVAPLRDVRRALKDRQGTAPEGPVALLRQSVKDVELEAEWHEQRLLGDLLDAKATGNTSGETALANFAAYLEADSVEQTIDIEALFQFLVTTAGFPPTD